MVSYFEGEASSISDQPTPKHIMDKYGLPDQKHISWKAYGFMFRSPWFTRTWVLQEIALAKKAEVNYGCFCFTWDQLVKSFYMNIRLMSSSMNSGPPEQQQGMLNMVKILDICRFYARDRSPIAWLYAIRITRDFKVTDIRDRIIGIHGIVVEQPLGSELLQPFRADYTVSAATLYHRFAIHLADIGVAQPLLNFAGLHRRGQVSNIPSWAPDWSAQDRDVSSSPLAMLRPQTYMATGMALPAHTLGFSTRLTDPDILAMMGDIIDTISQTTEPFFGPPHEEEAIQARKFLVWHDSANELFTKAIMKNETPASGFDARVNSFATTLLVNDLYTGKNAISTSSPIYWPQWTHREALESLQNVANGSGRLLTGSGVLSAVDTFKMQMITACYGRRFGVTERGYMTLVPHCAEVGDRIALFLGAPVPFVVRETEDKLGPESKVVVNLVGDTYVHGIMEGEGMDFESFSLQKILIR